jgi:hypothetical protein
VRDDVSLHDERPRDDSDFFVLSLGNTAGADPLPPGALSPSDDVEFEIREKIDPRPLPPMVPELARRARAGQPSNEWD